MSRRFPLVDIYVHNTHLLVFIKSATHVIRAKNYTMIIIRMVFKGKWVAFDILRIPFRISILSMRFCTIETTTRLES